MGDHDADQISRATNWSPLRPLSTPLDGQAIRQGHLNPSLAPMLACATVQCRDPSDGDAPGGETERHANARVVGGGACSGRPQSKARLVTRIPMPVATLSSPHRHLHPQRSHVNASSGLHF